MALPIKGSIGVALGMPGIWGGLRKYHSTGRRMRARGMRIEAHMVGERDNIVERRRGGSMVIVWSVGRSALQSFMLVQGQWKIYHNGVCMRLLASCAETSLTITMFKMLYLKL